MVNRVLIFFVIAFTPILSSAQQLNQDVYDPEKGLIPFYTTDKNKPFRYGYPFSIKECLVFGKLYLDEFEIKNGEVVADVGAANGWMDGAISVITDSVTFYVQDINSIILSEVEFNKVVKYFSGLRSRGQTNKFIRCIGDEKKNKTSR